MTYRVGYCRPPKARQWQPGQSGNPRGRPRGAKNRAKHPLLDSNFERWLKELSAKAKHDLREQYIRPQLLSEQAETQEVI